MSVNTSRNSTGSSGGGRSRGVIQTFKSLPELNTIRHDASVCVVNLAQYTSSPQTTTSEQQAIVVVGGRDPQSSPTLNQVELLEWNVQRRWWPLPPLVSTRCGCALVAHNQRLFCLGGLGDDSVPQASMETFDMGTSERWEILPTIMGTQRMYPGAVAFTNGSLQHILVVGGKDPSFQELDTCELYTVETGQWEPCPAMTTKRFACGLVYLPSLHSVVAIGGFNTYEWTKSMEIYDIRSESWNEWPPMIRAVQFISATVLAGTKPGEDYIVVCGQPVEEDDSETASAILQCYNVLTEQWIIMPPSSYIVGAAMTSIDQCRIVTVGGGRPEEASGACRFWVPNLPRLFGEDHINTSVMVEDQSVAPSVQDESTVHPWLYGPSGNAGVAPSVSSAGASSLTNRRKVENKSLLDSFGVPVQFTGFLHAETEKPHGKGQMTWILNGDRYEGRFEQGARTGRGHMMYHNGDSFVGFFQNDLKEGKGVYTYQDGRVYEGNYHRDFADDAQGRMVWRNGTEFVGEFFQGKRTGRGKITFPSSNVIYEGEFVNGKYHGYGHCHYQDGSIYSGEWKSGAATGQGKLVASDGRVLHDGKWMNDQPV